jgi:integrase
MRGREPCWSTPAPSQAESGAGGRASPRRANSSARARPCSPLSAPPSSGPIDPAALFAALLEAMPPTLKAEVRRRLEDGLEPANGNGQDADAIPDNFIAELGGASKRRLTMRAYGPYEEKLRTTTRYRVVVRERGKKDRVSFYGDPATARAEVTKVNREAALQAAPTVANAIEDYRRHQVERGNRPVSIRRTVLRLEAFFAGKLDARVVSLTPNDGERLYTTLRQQRTVRNALIAADSQLNALGSAKTFARWLVKKRYTKVDFLAEVESVGRRKKGKTQLTTDEGRRFLAKALELAAMGDVGATAAATALLLGLRSSEVTERIVRDLDAGGTILNVTASKTATGIRRVELPSVLRPHLQRLADGRETTDLLFGGKPPKTQGRIRRRTSKPLEGAKSSGTWLLRHVHRVCDLAGVRRVCTHALRGQHSSEAVAAGATAHAVAAMLGHASFSTTQAHYIRPGALASAQARRVELALLPVETTDARVVSNLSQEASAGT